MVDAVFRTFDAQGHLAVDASMINHFCRKTGTGVTIAGSGATGASRIEISIAGMVQPIIAVIPAGGYAVASNEEFVSANIQILATDAPAGTSYTYYLFDHAPSLPANSNSHLRLWDNAGRRTFDSGYWPLKALALFQMPAEDGAVVTASGRSLAVGCGAPGGHYYIESAECRDGFPTPDTSGCNDVWTQMSGKRYGGRITNSGQTFTAAMVGYDDALGTIGDEAAYLAFVPWYVTNQVVPIDVTGIPLNSTFF